MSSENFIVITGAAGFIGSCVVAYFNELGIDNLILVDDFSILKKTQNLHNKKNLLKKHRDQFIDWFDTHYTEIDCIIHLGARTDTTTDDKKTLKRLNTDYTKDLFERCAQYHIDFLYASSAATYGSGELGYADDELMIPDLQPLNPYAVSKQEVDKWILGQKECPPRWIGLKFFNVYGPNEYHKGRMASVVYHAYRSIIERGKVHLFRSHRADIKDGEQMRDFIYVSDVAKVIYWWYAQRSAPNGIYNLGTGYARSFNDLVISLYSAINHPPNIEYIDTPEDIRDKYQYYTEATMDKLRAAGYTDEFMSIEDGVSDYVIKYLHAEKAW